jgi:trans-2,3-dihydro-3-hydroxyanthranilate isomerase
VTTSVPFFLVDVFADAPLTGNPLAVVADAEQLEEPVMRAVAREFNQSETTFVLPPTRPEASRRLRSFTPAGAEVVGAGHNALGAWWWLATAGQIELGAEGGAALVQEIGGRLLPLQVTGRNGRPEAIVMEQGRPELGRTVTDRDRRWASGRIPPPAVLPVRSSAAWCRRGWRPTVRGLLSSRAMRWDVRAGSACRSPAGTSGSAGPASSWRKARSPCEHERRRTG